MAEEAEGGGCKGQTQGDEEEEKEEEEKEVFKSLNFNPQIFINETLNTVDDLVDDAFNFFHQQASALLKTEGASRSLDLDRGIAHIRNMIQSGLDRRLGMWEKYCLHHCFAFPKGFSFPKSRESAPSDMSQDVLCDPDLDAQLDSLRDRLATIEKESAELNRELVVLERQSASRDNCAAVINEALHLCEENSAQDMFKEMVSTASELREKLEKLRATRLEDTESCRMKRICDHNRDLSATIDSNALTKAKLEDLQEFAAELKKM